ncbi:MAG TPA: carbohydrate kinase family protein [Streptosporangiaceae bacterium]|nr:carbohydrate kinase family protein [Streptosporangiaceae bacterium]
MRIAVTGSIATDHLMTFPGRFIEQLMPGKHDKIALSFLVDSLEIRRGGVAANMAFGLGCLGLRPLLVGTAGSDFGEYRDWLDRHGVDTSGVRESARHHTARFIGTTDADMNQIGSFYPGAMTEDRDIDLAELAGQVDLVLIGASDPDAMLAFTKQCIQNQIAFAADTSWQLARLDGEQVRSLITGADYLFCNEYEASLTEHKTGWSAADLSDRVGVRVTTLGSRGARVDRVGHPPVLVPAVPGVTPKEPTGAGDAFRAGFLAAASWGLNVERAAQLGNIVAVHALETTGTQEYKLVRSALIERFSAAYGSQAGAEIARHYI